MEKKNKGVIVLIVVLILIILALGGYIIYDKFYTKNDEAIETNTNEEPTDNSLSDEEEMSIVKEKVVELVDYLNEADETHCGSNGAGVNLIGTHILDSYFESNRSKNFWDEFGPVIMDCNYNEQYIEVFDGFFTTYVLMNEDQYKKYNEYFGNSQMKYFDSYDFNEYSDTDISNYLGYNYRVGYITGDGYAITRYEFTLDNIEKENDYYNVTLGVNNYDCYMENKECELTQELHNYQGTFKVELNDNHLKCYELFFEEY